MADVDAAQDKGATASRVRLEELALRLRVLEGKLPRTDPAKRGQLDQLRGRLGSWVRLQAQAGAGDVNRCAEPLPAPQAASDHRDEVRIELAIRLHDPFSESIRLSVPHPTSARLINIDRVRARRSFCIAWVVIDSSDFAHGAEAAAWSLWLPDAAIESKRRSGLVHATAFDAHHKLVATLRCEDIAEFARLVASRAWQLGDRSRLRVRSDDCSGEEYRRRSGALDHAHRSRRFARSGDDKPQLASCSACGRPLTDPASARRGYGPVCCRETSTKRAARISVEPEKTIFFVAGIDFPVWQRQVGQAAGR